MLQTLFVVVLLLTSVPIPDGGVLPDSIFYGLDLFAEDVELGFGSLLWGSEWKMNKTAEIAEERLGEAVAMVEANKSRFVSELMSRFNHRVQELIDLADEQNTTRGLLISNEASVRFSAVLQYIQEKVPPQAQESIQVVIDNSIMRAEGVYAQTRQDLIEEGFNDYTLPVAPPQIPVTSPTNDSIPYLGR